VRERARELREKRAKRREKRPEREEREREREGENTSKTLIPIKGSLTRPDPNGRAKGAPAGAMRTRRCTRAGYLDENATDIPPPIEWPIKMNDFKDLS